MLSVRWRRHRAPTASKDGSFDQSSALIWRITVPRLLRTKKVVLGYSGTPIPNFSFLLNNYPIFYSEALNMIHYSVKRVVKSQESRKFHVNCISWIENLFPANIPFAARSVFWFVINLREMFSCILKYLFPPKKTIVPSILKPLYLETRTRQNILFT